MKDWRDSRIAIIASFVITALVLIPKPWISSWGNVAVDVVLIPVVLWLGMPAYRRLKKHWDRTE